MHPSLLPNYRGCFSGAWAIINRETYTGISFHEMVKDVDKGRILFQKTVNIYPEDTAYSLYYRLISEFLSEFDVFFERYIGGRLEIQEMPVGGSFHYRKIPFDGIVNHNWSENRIEAFIRAMFFPPYKGAVAIFNDVEVEIDSLAQYKILREKNIL